MKKMLLAVFLVLLMSGTATAGALIGYTLNGAPLTTDQLVMLDDPSGTWSVNRVAISEVLALIASATTDTEGLVELATNAEAVTGEATGTAVTPDGLTDRMAAPGEIGATTPGIVNASAFVSAGSATPGFTFQDTDNAAGTATIYGNSSGGVNDIIMTLGVEDSTGESTPYIEVDGVSETVDLLKPVVVTGNVGATTYGSDGTISDAELLTLDNCALTEAFVGGGAGSAPVCTTVTGTGAPVLANTPTLITPVIGAATGTSLVVTAGITGATVTSNYTIVTPQSLSVTTEDDVTIGTELTSSVVLLTGTDNGDHDTLDLQDGTVAGQILTFLGVAAIDDTDTIIIDVETDSTCTNCPTAGIFTLDDPGDKVTLYWTGAFWSYQGSYEVD